MGGIERRLTRLEERSGERAVAKVKELFDSVSDYDFSLILAANKGVRLSAQQERLRAFTEAKLLSGGAEELLALAVRPEQCADEEGINLRLREVIEKAVLADGRRARLSRLVWALEEGER